MAKERDHALDVVLSDLLSDVTIYICAGTVLGKQRQNWASRNMSDEAAKWTL
jgi:hypothetical protein